MRYQPGHHIANSRYALRLNQPVMVSILRHCERDALTTDYLHESELQHIFDEIDIVLLLPICVQYALRVGAVSWTTAWLRTVPLRQLVDQANTSPLQLGYLDRCRPCIAEKLPSKLTVWTSAKLSRTATLRRATERHPLRRHCASFLCRRATAWHCHRRYTCLSDQGKINYEDFCDTLDASEKARHAEFGHGFGSTARL